MEEYRVFGPPGTGKTTYLGRQIARAAERYGPDAIMVASFTRSAAAELVNRDLPVNPDNLGTLHAMAYRLLGKPELTEKHIKDWNKDNPALTISRGAVDPDEPDDVLALGDDGGDKLNQEVQVLRALRVPEDKWPLPAQAFWRKWKTWKFSRGLKDFTDLIEEATEYKPPADIKIGFFDEVQDFTALELALVRAWGQHMDRVILAGDDDQCLYAFKGAEADAFLNPPVSDDHRVILSQSYRVPRAAHERADRLVRQISQREPKEYKPTEQEGSVVEDFDGDWKFPEEVIDLAEDRAAAGKSVMILSSCSYFLRPTLACLKERGLPFHNPFKLRRGDWNPLAARRNQLGAGQLLAAFMRRHEDHGGWRLSDFLLWVKQMQVKGCLIHRAGKNKIYDLERILESEREYLKEHNLPDDADDWDVSQILDQVMVPEAIEPALNRDLGWFVDHLASARRRGMQYPVKVLQARGLDALAEQPRIMPGTIHSVKGGQADCVIVYPDLSPAGSQEYFGTPAERDRTLRQYYVALTRTKDELVLCLPAAARARTRQPSVPMEV